MRPGVMLLFVPAYRRAEARAAHHIPTLTPTELGASRATGLLAQVRRLQPLGLSGFAVTAGPLAVDTRARWPGRREGRREQRFPAVHPFALTAEAVATCCGVWNRRELNPGGGKATPTPVAPTRRQPHKRGGGRGEPRRSPARFCAANAREGPDGVVPGAGQNDHRRMKKKCDGPLVLWGDRRVAAGGAEHRIVHRLTHPARGTR